MDWASNTFIVLLITDITGTVFFLAGEVLRRKFDDDVVFLRFLTNATVFAYLVPFVYIILWISYLGKQFRIIGVNSGFNLFYGTPLTLRLTAVLGWIWVGLFLALLAYRLYRALRLAAVCRGNIPEEDENVFRVFTEICAELGIDGRVSLCRNDSVNIPCITYYHGIVVILPLVRYTEKEAEVILYHELCHYLNGDLYLKPIGCIAAQLHVFNPAVHILLNQMDLLCERDCDRVASKKGKHRFTRKEYFRVIMTFLVDGGVKRKRYQLFALVDDKTDYERRVEYMMRSHVSGGLKRGTAVAFAACFLLGSSITSLAAGDGVMSVYEGLAGATKAKDDFVEHGELGEAVEVAEVFAKEYGLDPEKVIVTEEGIQQIGNVLTVGWRVPAGKTMMTSGFRVHEGDNVLIGVQGTPEDVEYEFGIKDPKAIMWTAGPCTGYTIATVTIEQTGRHYFFVTNLSETVALDADASVTIFCPHTDSTSGDLGPIGFE